MFSKEMLDKCIFKWDDLDGKTLQIRIIREEGWKFTYGIESGGGKNRIYLLHQIKESQ